MGPVYAAHILLVDRSHVIHSIRHLFPQFIHQPIAADLLAKQHKEEDYAFVMSPSKANKEWVKLSVVLHMTILTTRSLVMLAFRQTFLRRRLLIKVTWQYLVVHF